MPDSKNFQLDRGNKVWKNIKNSQEASNSSPLEENCAVQAGSSANSKRGGKQIEKEMVKKRENEEQNKWKLKREKEKIKNQES